MPIQNMVQALNTTLHSEMAKDGDVVVLGEDVGVNGGVFRVTEGLHDKYPERVFDTPLAESGIIGTSIGMAMGGLKPIAEMQFMGFALPGFNQMIAHAARMRNRSRGHFSVPLVIRMPCQAGIKALEHHSESTEAYYVHTPGLHVVMPTTPYDAKGLLLSAIRDPDPVIFLEPKKLYRSVKEDVPEEDFTIPFGKANVMVEGDDLTVISWGSYVHDIYKALPNLTGASIELIDLRSLSPLDTDTIITSVKKTGRALIVQEAPRTAGLGAEIAARIMERAMLSLKAPVERLAGFDIIIPGPQGEDLYLINDTRLQWAVDKIMSF